MLRDIWIHAKRKRDSAQPQNAKRKRDSAQPQNAKRKRDSAQPQKRCARKARGHFKKERASHGVLLTTPARLLLMLRPVGLALSRHPSLKTEGNDYLNGPPRPLTRPPS